MFPILPVPAEFAISTPGAELLWTTPIARKHADDYFRAVVIEFYIGREMRLNNPADVGPFSRAASFALQNN